ncbi:MAG: fold metallo-hydrolase [Bacteroidetes bacterium]|jgi:glyoxylase-like metal-dependent hydrolase (beta-lactamase superfamily II)/rhodanese-related sulfurtransferase|nr:fold metallo-hydrolase [Bacteroidota bacterium]
MIIEQIYTGCLAQGAYYISSEGEAAIIDPLREITPYLQRAEKDQVQIKYIFETHFHADFVSGHIDLANKTNAAIVFGPKAETVFKSYNAKDGEEFRIGKLTIKALHTPGHTPESTTYLLKDENGKDYCIFTGDTLFIGDVGRPDLAIQSGITQEDLAGMLYDSLHSKILPLANEVIVYPAHGAGSACGKNMSKETFDTLGNQKKVNYALQSMSKKKFIQELTTGILPAPQYFSKNALLNKTGYENVEQVLQKGSVALSAQAFEDLANDQHALVLDVRKPAEFAASHIPNAVFIGIDGQFAPWVGALIVDLKQPILLVVPEGREEEAVLRLSRVGYDNCLGFLKGGMQAWKEAGKETDSILSVSAEQFVETYKAKKLNVLDVRKQGEYEAQHLPNVSHKALDYINEWTDSLDKNKEFYIHCAGGYRSMIAASILKGRGYTNLIDVAGGFSAISKTGVETTAYVCPSTQQKGGVMTRLLKKIFK